MQKNEGVLYAKLAVIVLGGGLCLWGIVDFSRYRGVSAEPVSVNLADLEAGKPLPDKHVAIGEHYAVFSQSAYAYKGSKNDVQVILSPTKSIDYCYYPITSKSHPFVKKSMAFQSKNGALARLLGKVKEPVLTNYFVLVKTKQYKTIGDIPENDRSETAVHGLVLKTADDLDKEEKQQLTQQFPEVSGHKVMILEEGQRPPSGLQVWSLIIVGALIAAGGGAYAVMTREA